MIKNSNTLFVCSNCDAQFTKWTGKCLECGKWGTIAESKVQSLKPKVNHVDYEPVKLTGLEEIQGQKTERLKTNIGELDRVLGGGLVRGSLVLLGGEPGIGKSTLALQIASLIPDALYISGEESAEQIKLRADRLLPPPFSPPRAGGQNTGLKLGNATNVESIMATLMSSRAHEGSLSGGQKDRDSSFVVGMTRLAVIDSIQTIYSDEVEGESGNINQIKACAAKLMELAKNSGTIIILVGQVTKDGAVAGPKSLEHLVDVVLYLEGDKYHEYRILRAVKNRFGSTDEVGVFSMEENGLREVKNPSAAFLACRGEAVPGSAITCLMEGTRPILVEIQALVTKTSFGYPQRRASGFDLNRLQVLIGVLTKRAGLPLDSYDVFLNVAGGLQADEPAADLAVVLALASAFKNKIIAQNIAAFGEVGLGGEARPVGQTEKRLAEIKNMGFEFAVLPFSKNPTKNPGLKIAQIKNVKELVEKIVEG